MKLHYRPKGLPRRVVAEGIVAQTDITIHEGYPQAKVLVFENRKAMRTFYRKDFRQFLNVEKTRPARLCTRAAAAVSKLWTGNDKKELVDRRYFCLVLLVQGDLGIEVLTHEAVHVGFAWDFRTDGEGPLAEQNMREENVCYPAGIFARKLVVWLREKKVEMC